MKFPVEEHTPLQASSSKPEIKVTSVPKRSQQRRLRFADDEDGDNVSTPAEQCQPVRKFVDAASNTDDVISFAVTRALFISDNHEKQESALEIQPPVVLSSGTMVNKNREKLTSGSDNSKQQELTCGRDFLGGICELIFYIFCIFFIFCFFKVDESSRRNLSGSSMRKFTAKLMRRQRCFAKTCVTALTPIVGACRRRRSGWCVMLAKAVCQLAAVRPTRRR